MKQHKSRISYFLSFFLYNLCFFALQLGFIYSQYDSFISTIKFPTSVYFELIATFSIHLGLYALLSLTQMFLLSGIIKRSWHYFSPDQWLNIIWVLSITTLISANIYFFPVSEFSKLLSPPIPEMFILVLFYLSSASLIFLLLNSLIYRNSLILLVSIFCIIFCFTLPPIAKKSAIPPKEQSQPNIIILGIDSLSPESITTSNMPFLSKLLKNSTEFTNAISPLARTYPAWSSILTGLYAEHHHAEENLIAEKFINHKASIIWTLNQLGYDTVYATDDRRFNSMDESFGFQKIIGPRIGVNDILLGSFNDFPLSNLLINSPVGAWLFPYNYSSRASFFSYYPETFDKKIQKDLALRPQNKPVFLAVHFTLTHWPYAWAASLPEELNNEFSVEERNALYQNSLNTVDMQLHTLFDYLKKNHYFTNSLVIILSDHGETLYYPNSRLTNYQNYQGKPPSRFADYLKANTATVLDKSAGHGSDILSPKQYHNVLAFNIYEKDKLRTQKNKINTRVALIDLATTIFDFLHIKQANNDGISLLPTIKNPLLQLPERTFFIESGMFPNQRIDKKQVMKIGREYFIVNPANGQLEIKPEKLNFFAQQKLYGVIEGDWILALYPDKKTYIPVIQNLTTGQWTDDLHSVYAKKTPALKLYQQLKQFYGKKIFLPLP